jgi:heat shock protein HtpX
VKRDEIPADRGLTFAMLQTMVALGLLYLVAVAIAAAFAVWWLATAHGWIVPAVIVLCAVSHLVHIVRTGRRAAPGDEVPAAMAPELHAVVERLCARVDIPKPRVRIVPTDAPNALAIGLPGSTVLCVTRGLLRRLDPVELEAAVAHELSHIAHRDAAVMTLACSVGIMGEALASGGKRQVRKEGKATDRAATGVVFALPIGFGAGLYALSVLLSRRLSRYRELAADRAAAYWTGRPSALASALVKCSDDAARIPMNDLRAPRTVNALCLMPTPLADFRGHPAHPPLQVRLDRLAAISRELGA